MLINHLFDNFVTLFLLSAPWLLLGLLIAGLIQVFVPASLMSKQLGDEGIKTAVKAAFIGAPLPLCSCGVIPAALGLRKAGASKTATTAFLVSTPETGVDSVTMSYALLGPFMAVIRPVTAVVSAIVAGALVGKEVDEEEGKKVGKGMDKDTLVAVQSEHTESHHLDCCASKAKPKTKPKPVEKKACCGGHDKSHHSNNTTEVEDKPLRLKVLHSLHYSVTGLLEGSALWLIVGLIFAAMVQTWVPADFLSQWGDGLLAMLVMVLISIPMYICATASTPIAAGLLLSGVSPGAVLVFMMAGPATNVATLGVVAKELGRRAVMAYLTGVIGTAMVFGWLTNYLVATYGFEVAPQIAHAHEMLPPWLSVGSGVLLGLLILRNLLIKYGPEQMQVVLWANA